MVYAEARKKKTNQLVCNNKETLLWLANLGCIEMHPMHSSVIDYERCQESQDPNDVACGLNIPDFVVIDLDPYIHTSTQNQKKQGEPQYNSIQAFKAAVEVALELKEMMDELHLRSYVKTSGKGGLHIFMPISTLGSNAEPITYEKTREFAKKIGNLLVARIPKKVTWNGMLRRGQARYSLTTTKTQEQKRWHLYFLLGPRHLRQYLCRSNGTDWQIHCQPILPF